MQNLMPGIRNSIQHGYDNVLRYNPLSGFPKLLFAPGTGKKDPCHFQAASP